MTESWPEDEVDCTSIADASHGVDGSSGFNNEVGRALRNKGNRLHVVGDASNDVIIQSEQLLLLGDGFHSKSRAGTIPI